MPKKEPPKYERQLEEALQNAIESLKGHETDSAEYARKLTNVEKLHRLLVNEDHSSNSVSMDTLANVGANLLGILMIIKHESVNVITSKALSFVIRPKVL